MNILESIVRRKQERLAQGILKGDPLRQRYTPRQLLERFREVGKSQVEGRKSKVKSPEPRNKMSTGQQISKSSVPDFRLSTFDLRPSSNDLRSSGSDVRLPLVIAELKKASPSGGLLRPKYDPVALARGYQTAGAFAISVLTEQDFFQGSLDHLRAVRAAVDIPLLRKDFIIEPEQLKESRVHGADMVLLIATCLNDEQLRLLIGGAREEGLLPLVEVHNEEEVDRAFHAGAALLGINNRDLKSFHVDLQTGVRLARYIRSRYAEDAVIVAESGIRSTADIKLLSEAGCQAFLIGESFMRAKNPGDALAELLAGFELPQVGPKGPSRRSKVESRKSKVQSPKSKVQSPKSKVQSPRSKVQSRKSKVESRRSKVNSPEPRRKRSESHQVSKSAGPDLRPSTFDFRLSSNDLRLAERDFRHYPDRNGHFGVYGGKYVPETLMAPLEELEAAFTRYSRDPQFLKELNSLLAEYVGRPTPLTFAGRLSSDLAARVYFKREDLCHTGAHKINNALGQALLARRMGKERIVAETGAGQHGVATATVCALLGLKCRVYMGVEDMARQELNVFRMKLLGAEVVPVTSGTKTLKDAINETMRDWVTNVHDTHYLLGSVLGPHPYPQMVRDFQSVIGREARAQILEKEGRLPDFLIACVGGGSNALGLFYEFLADPDVALIGVEAGGRSLQLGDHAARFLGGNPGVLHGCCTYVLQDASGQIATTHSVSAGLDYAAIGPEHALMHDLGRIEFTSADDAEALQACRILSEREGLIPALESAHAVAELLRNPSRYRNKLAIINLSGRGDKDMPALQKEIENSTQ